MTRISAAAATLLLLSTTGCVGAPPMAPAPSSGPAMAAYFDCVRDGGVAISAHRAVSALDQPENSIAAIEATGRAIEIRGVDDPHIERDDYGLVAGSPSDDADIAIGVAHAPYLRVVDAMAADGIDLMLAGHTHGGQVCIPGVGALVTNCDLDRRKASGLSHIERPLMEFTPHDRPDMWLHVSAGLGTSPYAPIRFACPPEAILVSLDRSDIGYS